MGYGDPAANEQLPALQDSVLSRLDTSVHGVDPEVCANDIRSLLASAASAIDNDSPPLFLHDVAWARAVLHGQGAPPEYLRGVLEALRGSGDRRVSASIRTSLDALTTEAIARLEELPLRLQPCLTENAPHADLVRSYLNALLEADEVEAYSIVAKAQEEGIPVRDLYENVFAACQHEVGRLWQEGAISVAQEHYCTAATQVILARVFPWAQRAERVGRTAITTCVERDSHQLGPRMVADHFELAGWDAHFLGADTPSACVVEFARERQADVLAISATLSVHLREVSDLIATARAGGLDDLVVLVGGHAFDVDPGLWRRIGADGYAAGAFEAVAEAERLVQVTQYEA